MSQPPDDIAVKKQRFYDDNLIVVSSPEAKFKQSIQQLKDLNEENWIIREPGSGTRIVMKKLFKKNKMLPNITMEIGNNESIKQLIMANMGISIISQKSIELKLSRLRRQLCHIIHITLNLVYDAHKNHKRTKSKSWNF